MATHAFLLQHNPQPTAIPPFSQPGFFFNEGDHLRQQNDGSFHLLTALNQTTRQADARCAFFVRAERAVSPNAAPFGSVEFAKTLPDPVLHDFLDALVNAVRSTGAASLRLVNYPHCYALPQAERLTTKLLIHGFRPIEVNPNFFLPITDHSFERGITPAERRRLKKCRSYGFQFIHWQDPDITEIIDFLEETRQQQGYKLSVSTAYLRELLQKFPRQFPVFTVRDGNTLAALTVTVRVRNDILYTFLPASHISYRSFSPMVMLTDGLFTYCQQHSIRLLDLGVSLGDNHIPKPSLMRFKRNLGAQELPKVVFEKVL
jgi:hypothetical protein